MSAPLQSVGIDLGTTNSEIYTYTDNHPAVVPGPNGLTITPSRVVVDTTSAPDSLKFAQRARAKNILKTNPENEIYEPKRVIGRKMDDGYIRVDLHYWPFDIVEGDNGQPLYSVTGANNSQVTLTAVDVDAEILRTLKNYAKGGVTEAVITIPSYFNKEQIRETKEAGEKAGLKVLECLHEPVAAAIAYGHANNIENATVLVYDLGGGTFDCCIVRIMGGKYHIMTSDGHSHLGGADFDNAIVKMVADELREKDDIDIYSRKKDLRKLKDIAERAKMALSGDVTYSLNFECQDTVKGVRVTYEHELTRAEFERLIGRYIDVTTGYITRCLEQLGLKPENIDYVIPVGGSTRIPYVMQTLNTYFNREIDTTRVNIDEAVAAGAAIQAHALVNGDSLVIRNSTEGEEEVVVNPEMDTMDPMPCIPLTVYYSVGKGYLTLFNKGHQFKANSNGERKVRSNRNVNPPMDFMSYVPIEFFTSEDGKTMKYLGGINFAIMEPTEAENVELSLKADITCRGSLTVIISNRKENTTDNVVLRVRNDMLDNEEIDKANKLRNVLKEAKRYLLSLMAEPNLPAVTEKRETLIGIIQDLTEGGQYMDMTDILEINSRLNELKSQ